MQSEANQCWPLIQLGVSLIQFNSIEILQTDKINKRERRMRSQEIINKNGISIRTIDTKKKKKINIFKYNVQHGTRSVQLFANILTEAKAEV